MNSLERVSGVQASLGCNVGFVGHVRRVVQAERDQPPFNPDSRPEPAGLVQRDAKVAGVGPARRGPAVFSIGPMAHVPQIGDSIVRALTVHVVDLASGPFATVHQPHDAVRGVRLPANLNHHVSVGADSSSLAAGDAVLAGKRVTPVQPSGSVAEHGMDVLGSECVGSRVRMHLPLCDQSQVDEAVVREVAVDVLQERRRPLASGDRPGSLVRHQEPAIHPHHEMSTRRLGPGQVAGLGSTAKRFPPPQDPGRWVISEGGAQAFDSRFRIHAPDYTTSQPVGADWNDKNPDMPIRITRNALQRRVFNLRMDRRERLAKTTPKAVRSQIETMLGNDQSRRRMEPTEETE